MLYGSLVRKRMSLIEEARYLRKQHRRRKTVQKVLEFLTLKQLRMELRGKL